MDIGRAFSYPFQDPKWITKIVIGGLFVLLVPVFLIGAFVLSGYSLRVMRNVVSGTDVPLPEWDDIGAMFVDGIKATVITLIWSIPLIILSAINYDGDSFVLSCLTFILSALTSVFVLSALVPFALSRNFSDGLQFQAAINRVVSNLGDYIIVFLLGYVLGIIAAAGLIGLCVGVLFTIFYALLVNSHLGSQAYMRATGATAPPTQQAF
jgi:hypothetical protein